MTERRIENKGNTVIRRAFAERDGLRLHRVEILAQVTNKAMSTAYQMTEDVGLYGSGRPSPLYIVCELVSRLEEIEREGTGGVSAAMEVARYPLDFLRQLRGEIQIDSDARHSLNLLLKNISDANFLLAGRELKDITPGELREFLHLIMNCVTASHELEAICDSLIQAREASYPGVPFQRERICKAS